jgi:TRAP-type mannitol/chloroaromatic compound transport system permease small subunit
MCVAVLVFGIPWAWQGITSGEMSNNAGGLIRWPVFIMMPIGFALLLLQGWSELIKRLAYLQGLIEDPTAKRAAKSAEEELAEEIARLAEEKDKAAKAAAETK